MRRLSLLLAASLALPAAAAAQPGEDAVKATFLSKFPHYVQWPPASLVAGQPFTLCILGKDGLGQLADQAMAGQRIEGRPIAVRRIANAAQARGCHAAFVNGGSGTGQMLAAMRPYPILTITDARNGSARGMIHFALHNGRVGFHIDDAAAAQSRLGINARLLQLALSVKTRRS